MLPRKARTIDILAGIGAVAFVAARGLDILGSAASWTGAALLSFYVVWSLRFRSPYRTHQSSLHLNQQ